MRCYSRSGSGLVNLFSEYEEGTPDSWLDLRATAGPPRCLALVCLCRLLALSPSQVCHPLCYFAVEILF